MVRFQVKATSFVISCVSFIFLISSSPVIGMQGNLFPDLSQESDAAVTRRVKKGIAEVLLGAGAQYVSPYLPRIGSIGRDGEKDTFGPRTVKGAGTLLVISGAKDIFFGSKEKLPVFGRPSVLPIKEF